MIYIKSIVVISPNNNDFLAISTCINKYLLIILPITKIWVILAYPPFFWGVWYPLLSNLLYQVTKISHLMVLSSHCVVLISHITVLLSHSVVPLFYLTFDSTILILCSTNITCDCAFVTFGDSLNFFPHI